MKKAKQEPVTENIFEIARKLERENHDPLEVEAQRVVAEICAEMIPLREERQAVADEEEALWKKARQAVATYHSFNWQRVGRKPDCDYWLAKLQNPNHCVDASPTARWHIAVARLENLSVRDVADPYKRWATLPHLVDEVRREISTGLRSVGGRRREIVEALWEIDRAVRAALKQPPAAESGAVAFSDGFTSNIVEKVLASADRDDNWSVFK